MSTNIAKRSIDALFWSLAGSGGKAVAQLAIQIVLARMLGPHEFGQYSAVLIVLGIGWLLADGGFGAALVQKRSLQQADIEQALGGVLAIATVVAVVIMCAATLIAEQFSNTALVPMIQSIAGLVFLMGLSNVSTSLLRRELDMKRLQLIHVGAYAAGFGGVAIPMAAYGYGAWSLIAGFGVQTLLTCCVSFAMTPHSLRPRFGGNAALRAFGIKVVATNVANWATENLDRFLIGRLWGIGALGLYTVSGNLSRAPVGLLLGSAQTIAFSSAARIQDDDARTRKGYMAMMSAFTLITFPLFAIVAVEADVVLKLVYGDKWMAASHIFAVLAVTTPIYGIAALTGPILWARAAVEKELQSQLLVAVLLCAGLIALRDLPLASAVWIVPVIYGVRAAFLLVAMREILDLRWLILGRVLASGVLLAAVAIAADFSLHATGTVAANLWGGTIAIAAAGLAVLATLALAGKWLLDANLAAMLRSRYRQSIPIACVCRALRLRAS